MADKRREKKKKKKTWEKGKREKPQTGLRISCGKCAQQTAFPDWP